MKYRIISWLFFIISLIGIVCSILLMIKGSEPCSSDSCLIQILFFTGILLLIPSLIMAFYILIKSFRKN